MKVSYTVTFADYKAALRLHRRQKIASRLSFGLWFIAVPILAVAGLIIFVLLDLSKLTPYASILFGVECGLIWVSLFLPFWSFYNARKCFKQVFQVARENRMILLDITEEFVHSIIPGVSEGKFFWDENMALVQDEKVILIYVAKKRFVLIPSSFLSQADKDELRALVERKKARR